MAATVGYFGANVALVLLMACLAPAALVCVNLVLPGILSLLGVLV